ncbi:hypothetical protein D9M71_825690 [compost metagenome]
MSRARRECQQRTAAFGAPVAQIQGHQRADPALLAFSGPVENLSPRSRSLIEHPRDRLRGEIVLGREMLVEASHGQTAVAHHVRDRHAIDAVRAEQARGGIQNALAILARFFLG